MVANAVTAVERATAQQRLAAEPGVSAWVGANAGSGKTRVLTDRVLALLLEGTEPERILCLTYTRAAAAEMRIRIERTLAEWTAASDKALGQALARIGVEAPDGKRRADARQLFAQVVDAPVGLRIDTIHAFCQSVLGRFPLEAGVSPWFQVADERDALGFQARARDSVLRSSEQAVANAAEHLADTLPETGLERFIAELLGERGAFGPAAFATLEATLVQPKIPARSDHAVREAARLFLASDRKTDRTSGRRLMDWLVLDDPAIEDIEAVRLVWLTKEGTPRANFATNGVSDKEYLHRLLEPERARIEMMREGRLIAATLAASKAALTLGAALDGFYEREKRRAGVLDYDDLVRHTGDLLKGAAAWVHYKLDQGIDHVLIDEAQDTSPAQWDIVEALTAEFFDGDGASETSRTVFAVGDPKQSIYRFQGARPARFEEMRRLFEERAGNARQTWRTVPLEVSFRAAPVLLEAVNAVFDDALDLGSGAPSSPHAPSRAGAGGRVEIWPLEPAPAPDAPLLARQATISPGGGRSRVERLHSPPPTVHVQEQFAEPNPFDPPRAYRRQRTAETALADRVAERIAAWLARREPVSPGGRPMQAGDIMILLPRRSGRDFVPRVIAALKQHGVPVGGIDRIQLLEELAVLDLMAVADFVLLPEDDLTLATVLKGPLFGFDDDALFALAHGRAGSLWAALLDRTGTPRFDACIATLRRLLGRADYIGVHAFFADLLAAGGLRRRIAARLGEEANEPVDEFLNAALDYERRHVPSLQGFLHWLRSGNAEVKRQLDGPGTSGVRVSTVHGAKGLEAPVVILPDTTFSPVHASNRPALYRDGGLLLWPPSRSEERMDRFSKALLARVKQEEEEERRRLLYVAMTRAADRLVVCGWHGSSGEPPEDCWYATIRGKLTPLMSEVDDPDFDEPLLVMERRAAVAGEAERAEAQEAPPALPGWAQRPVAPLSGAAAASAAGEDAFAVSSPLRGKSAGRFRRGQAIHKLLELLPAVAPERRLATARRFLAADASLDEDAEAAAQKVMAVLDNPAFGAVFGPGSRAEAPLVGRLGGQIASARIDRLVLLPEKTLIVDFKSGRAPPAGSTQAPAGYLRQLARYTALLQQMRPGIPVQAALLWTEAPLLMPVPQQSLAPYMP